MESEKTMPVKTARKTSKASTGSKYVLKITTVTRTTPADRATILKLKAATQAELKRRGAKNVKVEVVKM